MTPRIFAVALTGLFALAGLRALALPAHAGAADVTVGALRAPTSKAGAALRAEARMSAKVLGNVPHGTRLMVEAVDGKWIRTTAKLADGSCWQHRVDVIVTLAACIE